MCIVLDKTLSDSVSGELQACSLWPNDTARVKKMFCEYRRKRVRGARFGFRMDKQQLAEWVGCDVNSAAKLVKRWTEMTKVNLHSRSQQQK